MRTFTLGSGTDRKFVLIEVNGSRMSVVQGKADGSTKRNEKDLANEAAARAASDMMARELMSRGFVEQAASGSKKSRPAEAAPKPAAASKPAAAQRPAAPTSRAAAKPAPRDLELDDVNESYILDDDDAPARSAAPVLARMATAPATAADAPKKKKKGGKKKRKQQRAEGELDKRVIAGVAAGGLALVALLGYLAYDTFLKPPTIVGIWKGARLDFEIGKPMVRAQYGLVLDENKHASLTLQEDFTYSGTYTLKGNRLKLSLKSKEGDGYDQEYKYSIGHATLDLLDPTSGKKVVELVRQRGEPSGGGGAAPPPSPEKDAVAGAGAGANAPVDTAADARLASVQFSPKDGAFKVGYPKGWSEPETGSRPDNTYSWGRFTNGSAKIQVFADVAGSLMSGSDSAQQHEEGSESAPVHRAHELYKKTVSEEYTDFKESAPTLFKGSSLGEGRIAAFTASGGGVFGGKINGYRVTLLTSNRRITLLCEAPAAEFSKLKPTFLAVCRSVSN